jgi:exodeoxyribonuclease V beta subunit
VNPLDTATLPLTGLQLIEASAGTGKTHAITTLYLRLLLETPRTVREILVVTFTHAATDELRGRIRRRLVEARGLLGDPARVAALEDTALRDVLQRQLDADGGDAARHKLARMLAGIDEAAIFTIHSFCQRALREHAFESGEMFDAELTESQQDLVEAAVADWWRRRFYPDAALAGFAAGRPRLATPGAVGAWLGTLLHREVELRLPPCDIAALKDLAGRLRTQWPQQRTAFRQALDDSPHLSRRQDKSLHLDFVAGLAALDAWAAGDALAPADAARALGQQELDGYVTEKRRGSGGHAPQLAFAAELDELFAQLDALELHLLGEARGDVRARVDRQKRHANLLAFDDLINRLRDALLADGGERLAARIAAQFPAAMIDEFQDTDPAQYDIFSRIWRNRPDSCLLMIGDPKQAIYSFRGADIYAYVRARHETAPAQRHTMATNWRSSAALVDGVDALFAHLPDAFRMGADVPWVKVGAAGRADAGPLLLDGERPVPLQFWIRDDDERHNKDEFREDAAAALAVRCAQLLSAAAAGNATLAGKALAPRDIAVLVRSHHEAARVQDALLARGVGSALASQHSVFNTTEATDLARVLDALLDPADERALRRALVTPLWGMTADALARLLDDEAARDALQGQVHELHAHWLARGFMPMFRRWLHGAGVPANLLGRPRGERALTNLLHLAELLQQASREHASPDELRRWYARALAGDALVAGQAQQLRLESDENLVQVVTMHKSKGLEYPVVFLPFAGIGREAGSNDAPLCHDPAADHRLVLDHVDPDNARARAGEENLAEDMRLLYVALTRASHLCCVQWGAVPGFSALALLLLGEPGEALATVRERHLQLCGAGKRGKSAAGNRLLRAAVQQRVAAHPQSIVVLSPPQGDERYRAPGGDAPAWQVRPVLRTPARDWRVTSFSALASQSPDQHESAPTLPVGAAGEDAPGASAGGIAAGGTDIAAFPRGTRAGHFFHELLEHLDFPQARGPYLEHVIRQQCLRHGIAEHWVGTVANGVENVLDTPLEQGLLLRDLTLARRSNECEFHYPLAGLEARALERVVPGLAGLDTRTPRFTFAPVSGLMHGYIDLVFEHAGRWYVADWKTNWLGPTPAHYGRAALEHAMRHHAYDLQYWVYSIALHRHLAQKLGDGYKHEHHFGGVYYFFLRGMRPDSGMRSGVFFERPERAHIEALDALLHGRSP